MDFIVFTVALALLIYGADVLVKQAEILALHFNISHFVIGATLIAFGTSLPELAASVIASYENKSTIALSNVLGSNIFNVGLILGLALLFIKKSQQKQIASSRNFSKDLFWVILPPLAFVVVIFDNAIKNYEGIFLILLMFAYIVFLFLDNKSDLKAEVHEANDHQFNLLKASLLLILGFILVIFGAEYTITSASNIAKAFNVSEWLIGFLLLAFGTSLPELVVSIKAAMRNNASMILGNIIGSNLANLSIVLGAAALVHPINIALKEISFDVMMMVIMAVLLVFMIISQLYNKAAALILLLFLSLILLQYLNLFI